MILTKTTCAETQNETIEMKWNQFALHLALSNCLLFSYFGLEYRTWLQNWASDITLFEMKN